MGYSQSDDADDNYNNERIYNMRSGNQDNDIEENGNDEKFKDFEEIGSNYNII